MAATILPEFLLKQVAHSQGHCTDHAPTSWYSTPLTPAFRPWPTSHLESFKPPAVKCKCGHWCAGHWGNHCQAGCKTTACACYKFEPAPTVPTVLKRQFSLKEEEYRFWVDISDEVCTNGKCRFCGTTYYTAEGRHNHTKNETNCTQNLRMMYAALLKEGYCAICGRKTSQAKWGVPLCGENCLEKWRFDPLTSETMDAAKEVLRDKLMPTLRPPIVKEV